MADIAELGFSVDSKPISNASKELGGLSTAAAKTESATQRMNREADKSVRSLNNSSKAANALGKVLGTVIAYMGSKAIIDMADQYTEMSSRIKQVTADTDEYNRVQARLLDTANNTYRPLQEAQEVYIRTSKAIKDLGYNTDQALDITDSFSYLLVTNAASADSASSSINAYSKAIQTGRVNSESWQSILTAMPSVVGDISKATGESEAAIRKLGIEGKLSLTALNEALLRSKDSNLGLADAMDTTVGDATVAFRNSLQVFIGKVNESSGATSGLTDAIGKMAEILQDPATIRAAQELAAAVVLAFGKIIEVASTTNEVFKFMGESLAAAMHGPALDDVVRMQDHIASLEQQALNTMTEIDTLRAFRINPFKSTADYEAEYQALLAKIAFYKQAVIDAQTVSLPSGGADEESAPSSPKNTALVNANSGALTANTAAINARNAAIKAAEQAEKNRLENIAKEIQSLERLRDTYGMTEAQVKAYDLSAQGATSSQIALATSILNTIDAMDQQANVNREAKGIADSLRTEEQQIAASYEERKAIILAAEYDTELERQAILTSLKTEHDNAMLELNGSYWDRWLISAEENLLNFDELSKGVIDSFTAGFGSAFESMIFDFETLDGAAETLFTGMARGVVNAIGQMIAQELALIAVQKAKAAWSAISSAKEVAAIGATTTAAVTSSATLTASSVASGAAIAAAYTPASIAANIATMGGAATAATASMAAAVPAMTATLAASRIAGFEKGGYTGNMGTKDVAGVVHGREFVFDAAATARIGAGNLEAMRSGKSMNPGSSGDKPGGGIVINAPITVEATDGMSDDDARKQGELMGAAFEQRIKQVMADEMAAGGMLWQS